MNTKARALKATVLVGLLVGCNSDATAPTTASAPLTPRRQIDPVPGHSGPDNAILRWNDELCQAIRVVLPGPTVVARAIAVLHTATYDAWAAYDAHAIGTQLGGTLRRPATERTGANKDRAISYAAYRALSDLFPTQKPRFDAAMRASGYDPNDASTDPTTSVGVGNVAAAAVLAARHHDGSNQLGNLHAGAYSDYTGYVPVNTADVINDPNHWQPLRVSNGAGGFVIQQFSTPHWNRVTPFALTSANQFRPPFLPNQLDLSPSLADAGSTGRAVDAHGPNGADPDAMEGTGRRRGRIDGYSKQVEQILRYSADLSDRTKVIAEYWADGPDSELPPGHWCLFAAWVSHRDHHTVDDDAKLFFALGNAMLDASIAAWDAKRVYDSVRPVTAVHYLMRGKLIHAWGGPGKGTIWMRGEDWEPYQPVNVVTPPFPEFISGHSAFSAAGAEILRRFTGSDRFGGTYTQPKGSSRVERGLVPARDLTLHWATFSAAADEAALSRRYGGIHFEQGDVQSRAVGRQVGAQVWERAARYWEGTR